MSIRQKIVRIVFVLFFVYTARHRLGVVFLPLFREGRYGSHLSEDKSLSFLHVGTGRFGTEEQRVGQCGSDKGTVVARELGRIGVEMLFGHRLRPVDARSHLDGIEVYLHDALFAPEEFDKDGEIRLDTFSYEIGLWPEEDVFCCLLRDGAGPSAVGMCLVVLYGIAYGLCVETMVQEEKLVLAGHHRHRQML